MRTGRRIEFKAEAILFDLDGVLVDSVACIEGVWRRWAASRSLLLEDVLRVSHGRRTIETVRLLVAPGEVESETTLLDAAEEGLTEGLQMVPGARELLARLPPGAWAVVTSGRRSVAEFRMRHTGLPLPLVLVTAEEVANGKPNPEGYLLAARRLGRSPVDCLVVEDAPVGIAAAQAAGMRVIAVASTHPMEELQEAGAIVPALSALTVEVLSGDGERPTSGGLVVGAEAVV